MILLCYLNVIEYMIEMGFSYGTNKGVIMLENEII